MSGIIRVRFASCTPVAAAFFYGDGIEGYSSPPNISKPEIPDLDENTEAGEAGGIGDHPSALVLHFLKTMMTRPVVSQRTVFFLNAIKNKLYRH